MRSMSIALGVAVLTFGSGLLGLYLQKRLPKHHMSGGSKDTKPCKTPIWFALGEDRPLFAFAGLWTSWSGIRGPKSAPVEGRHELFGFLTTEANAFVAPIHPKAMPVILTTPEETDLWLSAEAHDALALQRPLAHDALRIVATGEKEDRSPELLL